MVIKATIKVNIDAILIKPVEFNNLPDFIQALQGNQFRDKFITVFISVEEENIKLYQGPSKELQTKWIGLPPALITPGTRQGDHQEPTKSPPGSTAESS